MIIATVDGGGGECHDMECYCSVHLQEGKEEWLLRFDLPYAKTSNEAEYSAVIAALEEVIKAGYEGQDILIHSDSKLVVMQCQKKWKVKARHLLPFRDKVLKLAGQLGNVTFEWVPRAEVAAILGH
jgi:ribonuclease HI